MLYKSIISLLLLWEKTLTCKSVDGTCIAFYYYYIGTESPITSATRIVVHCRDMVIAFYLIRLYESGGMT